MRILLDAKDLINTVEHDKDVTFTELEQYIQNGNHSIALTSTNILEFSASLADTGDFLQMRSLLQKVERLPLSYVKEWTIPYEELLSAKRAFDSGNEYQGIAPYVRRWDDTIAPVGQTTPTEPLVALRLDEIIYMLWKRDPTALQFPSKQVGNLIRSQYEAKRLATPAPRRLVQKEFAKTVERQFGSWGIPVDGTDLAKLAKWIYADPSRCPGLRVLPRLGEYVELYFYTGT